MQLNIATHFIRRLMRKSINRVAGRDCNEFARSLPGQRNGNTMFRAEILQDRPPITV